MIDSHSQLTKSITDLSKKGDQLAQNQNQLQQDSATNQEEISQKLNDLDANQQEFKQEARTSQLAIEEIKQKVTECWCCWPIREIASWIFESH